MIHPSITRLEALRLRKAGLIRSELPPHLPVEVLRADLSALIQEANREQDPMRREVLVGQIEELRRQLGNSRPNKSQKGIH